jgi:molecular chaperone GrpE
MDRIVKIPVRVQPPPADEIESAGIHTGRSPAHRYQAQAGLPIQAKPAQNEPLVPVAEPSREPQPAEKETRTEETDWRDMALRLQAEMDNFRKRQQRLAQDQIQTERQRLLRGYLQIVDDLERALAAPTGDTRALVEGVQLTRRTILQRLQQEGVTRIEAQDRPFDPEWHEAVSAVPHDGTGAAPGTVIKVLEPGYRLGEQLLRPARVIVVV